VDKKYNDDAPHVFGWSLLLRIGRDGVARMSIRLWTWDSKMILMGVLLLQNRPETFVSSRGIFYNTASILKRSNRDPKSR